MTPETPLISIFVADEAEMIELGEDLALALKAGDCLALTGDLGAGKSTLARAFIRAMADDDALEVPSPTFTLVQQYDLRLPVAHFDLYRLSDPLELHELGLEEILEDGICLIEWPERAEGALPEGRVCLEMSFEGGGRRISVRGGVKSTDRIRRVLAIRAFLNTNGMRGARRRFLTGDASARAYEHIYAKGQPRRVLMDAPRHPNGPPIRDGRRYSEIVHLAEDVYPFVAVDLLLRRSGLAAPEILAADCEAGILLLEDLGTEGVLDASGQPIEERYEESVACLAQLHSQTFEREIVLPDGHVHRVPDFDRTAMKMEAELLIDWHLPWRRDDQAASDTERGDYLGVWDHLIDQLDAMEKALVLRDFHSPNIIWRPDAPGVGKVGLIDFQDAMIGPSAYDLASLLQDARVTIDESLADRLMRRYLSLRHGSQDFEEEAFVRAFHIVAAQRNCKLAGLWVRLMKRDGKPTYMRHMPRTLQYLATTLKHPALAPLRDWCERVGIEAVESSR